MLRDKIYGTLGGYAPENDNAITVLQGFQKHNRKIQGCQRQLKTDFDPKGAIAFKIDDDQAIVCGDKRPDKADKCYAFNEKVCCKLC